jgi:deferrochelatase/peroxidase EfeB
VPVGQRGPGHSYRPENPPPSIFGRHQPGVATPVLDHVQFLALDLQLGSRDSLSHLIACLSEAAEQLMAAEHRNGTAKTPAGRLTITIGFGPAIFGERFGLARRRPVALVDLPAFPGDAIAPSARGGDLCIQICAEQEQPAAGAAQTLLQVGSEQMRVRWSQRGAMVRPGPEPPATRPRNILGFKEATGNPRRGMELDRQVWVARADRTWMIGGTYLVVRRVRADLDAWQRLAVRDQEQVIGRHKDSGAPLG